MTIPELLSWANQELEKANVPSPRVDAEWILSHILGCSRSALLLHPTPPPNQIVTFREFIAKRAKRIPLQHILGETEFYGLPFQTSHHALIPRPDTESLIEAVVDYLPNQSQVTILDIGTGSGIIAITLAHELPQAKITALDISKPALQLAKKNAKHNAVLTRTHFVCGDLTQTIATTAKFDAILSNPPYIPTDEIQTLDPEVRDFDPHLALDGGTDGLDIYRKLIPNCVQYLKPKGLLALEIGHDQASAITEFISHTNQMSQATVLTDLAGQTRVVYAHKTQ